jgi:D-hydroxyproline dehydrogenase subunit alpha
MKETFELAVIGAGPAGMEAAIVAAEAGAKVVVVDNYLKAGGQYFKALPAAFKPSKMSKVEKEGEHLAKRLADSPATRIYDALVWGIFEEEKEKGWLVALSGSNAPKEIHADMLILANGAYETPVAFPGWTLPGVITCGAALTLVKTQRVLPGKRALVTGTGPLLLSAAAHLIDAGMEVVGVCENTKVLPRGIKYGFTMLGQLHRLQEGVKYYSTMFRGKAFYRTGWSILEVHGKDHVEEAVIVKVDGNGIPIANTEETLKVDTVISGYGLIPNTDLARMIGCKMEYNPQKGGWVPERDENLLTSLSGVYVAGDGAGIGGAENARLEGRMAGISAAVKSGHLNSQTASEICHKMKPAIAQQHRFGCLLGDLFAPKVGWISLARDDTLICRCEELTRKELASAITEGCESVTWVKRKTRAGMGLCQGRSCGRQVALLISQETGIDVAQLFPDTPRPPERPITLESLVEKETN